MRWHRGSLFAAALPLGFALAAPASAEKAEVVIDQEMLDREIRAQEMRAEETRAEEMLAQETLVVRPDTPRPEPGTVRVQTTEAGLVHIDAMDADLRHVLRQMADAAGANLILDEGVSGRVTLRLRDVRFRDALDAVLETQGLAAEIDGNIIRVAPVAKLTQEWRQRSEVQKHWEASAPLETRIIRLDYADPATVIPLVRDTLSPRGSVRYDPRTRSLIIRDVKGSDALGF